MIKKIFLYCMRCIAIFVVGFTLWTAFPITKAPFADDPAIAYLNNKDTNPHYEYISRYHKYDGHQYHYVKYEFIGAPEIDYLQRPLIIFIHGFPGYWYSMQRQMDGLSSHYEVISLDMLGAGYSDAPKDQSLYSIEYQAKMLENFIEMQRGNEKVILVGHDWGGAFALAFAQSHPEHIKKTVGIAAPPANVFLDMLQNHAAQRESSTYVRTLKNANPALLVVLQANKKAANGTYAPLQEHGLLSQQEVSFFARSMKSPKRLNAYLNWYRANIPEFDMITDDDYYPAKGTKFNMPVLLIRGSDDDYFHPDYIEHTKDLADDVTYIEVDGAAHRVHLTHAETVNAEILAFLLK